MHSPCRLSFCSWAKVDVHRWIHDRRILSAGCRLPTIYTERWRRGTACVEICLLEKSTAQHIDARGMSYLLLKSRRMCLIASTQRRASPTGLSWDGRAVTSSASYLPLMPKLSSRFDGTGLNVLSLSMIGSAILSRQRQNNVGRRRVTPDSPRRQARHDHEVPI